MASRYNKRYYILGIPATIFSTVVASGIFGTFRSCSVDSKLVNCTTVGKTVIPIYSQPHECVVDEYLRLAIGILGVISVILAALMTFMDYGSAREKHKTAADSYDEILRFIDTILKTEVINRGDTAATLQDIQSRFSDVEKHSPSLPSKFDVDLGYRVYSSDQPTETPARRSLDSHSITRFFTGERQKKGSNLVPPKPSDIVDPDAEDPPIDRVTTEDQKLADILLKLKDSDERRDDYLREENNFDSDDDVRKVAIDFDFEAARPGDVLNDHRVVDPLTRAVDFELKRMKTFNESSLNATRSSEYGPLVSPRNIGRSRSGTTDGAFRGVGKGSESKSPRRFTNALFKRGAEGDRATSKVSAAYPSHTGPSNEEAIPDTQVHNSKDDDRRDISNSNRSSPENETILSSPPKGSDEYV
jgi:hypothetical protein